ncbi:MAG: DUF1449 family protein [Myxococcales bacterium]|nr:DUF1449 family protein [Myxococcales bacterium]
MALWTILFSYPVVVFTVGMAVVVAYWLLVVLGALGVEVLDFDIDGVADGAVEAAAEGAIEGAGEAAAEALADGASEAMTEAAGDLAHAASAGGGFLAFLGVGRIPVTMVLTLLIISGWAISYALVRLQIVLELSQGLLPSTFALGLAIVLASMVTSLLARPLTPVFTTHRATRHSDLVGRVVTVLTGRVDHNFGQAELIEGGADLVLQVRCPLPNALARDAKALLIAYDPEEGVFQIEAYDEPAPPA